MKQLLCLLLLSFVTVISYSQLVKKEIPKEITIGKLKQGFSKYAELSYYVSNENKDTTYHLYYKDLQYKQLDKWSSIFFTGGSTTLNDLYKTLLEAMNSDKGKEISFTLGESRILVVSSRMLGGKYLALTITDKAGIISTMNITKGQLNDLFGITEE